MSSYVRFADPIAAAKAVLYLRSGDCEGQAEAEHLLPRGDAR
jgi:hypothetical protein